MPIALADTFEELLYEKAKRQIYYPDCTEDNTALCRLRDDYPTDLKSQVLEIWSYKSVDGRQDIVNKGLRDLDELGVRAQDLPAKLQPQPKDGETFLGGLRLLVQQWPKKWPGKSGKDDSFISWLAPYQKSFESGQQGPEPGFLPFGIKTLEAITEGFNLPRTYPHDLLGDYPIPLRLKKMDCFDETLGIVNTNIGITLQGPKTDDTEFISVALSYDPIRNITSGFLGYTTPTIKENGEFENNVPPGEMDIVIKGLCSEQYAPSAAHPLLLPTLILNAWCDFNSDKLEISRQRLWGVRRVAQKLQGLVEKLVANGGNDNPSHESLEQWYHFHEDLEEEQINAIHKEIQGTGTHCNDSLLKEHSFLLHESFPFVEDLVESTAKGLDEIRLMVDTSLSTEGQLKEDTLDGFRSADHELTSFLAFLNKAIKGYSRRREQQIILRKQLFGVIKFLLKRSDVQNSDRMALASNNVAKAAKRDSSTLMGISFISALFLPGTAIATIFGMVEFITVDPVTDVFKISPTWTIYWKWTGPATALVLLLWLAWYIFMYRASSPRHPPSHGGGFARLRWYRKIRHSPESRFSFSTGSGRNSSIGTEKPCEV